MLDQILVTDSLNVLLVIDCSSMNTIEYFKSLSVRTSPHIATEFFMPIYRQWELAPSRILKDPESSSSIHSLFPIELCNMMSFLGFPSLSEWLSLQFHCNSTQSVLTSTYYCVYISTRMNLLNHHQRQRFKQV